ncbi:glyS protein [Agrilactobacillus composti DSM 18527 = JCM 14202]|uniref:Glycine--tRNA ligase beta subunit n=1 Tax=Agrilactobacillus composti DSM 18527 = JCM 14202 TaxID=1423734 RepID=A0A0R1XTK4_9LACO|nr:glycine--tRNA ligase subunit beta [Agrilactobacillus composti]KRM33450.1 glyS protein [Agrilactobacillus composti DSM 18527 = JCM 14202]
MSHDFLLEIGLEEMPAHVVSPSIDQLAQRTQDFLNDQKLEFQSIQPYSTPRRLALLISGLADKQADVHESLRGPAKQIAQDDTGNWTKAAQGFARGQGATPDDLTFKEIKGKEYVFLEKNVPGKAAATILPGLKEIIMAMTFPTRMHWANYDFEYIRPIHWLVALLDDQVIPFEILDIQTGRTTQGHRFLGEAVTLKTADDYEQALKDQFVIANADDRKELIVDQIQELASDHNWQVDLDEDLLEEVNNLVEYPTTFSGNFDKKYLQMPDEVLITSMKDNQRYFYARSQSGELLPIFIGVRNGNRVHLDNIIAGNEKVLVARLEDAQFFYEEDQKKSIADYVGQLKNVSFHDKIGSMYDKMQRTSHIAQFLGVEFGLSTDELADLKRAAAIYKFDLVTQMVGEFPELQGIMGEKYALLKGEKPSVATAIREHYMPTSATGKLPTTNVGAVLSIADKLDSILSFFAVALIPSGSNDPYALRRQAFGIVRILEAKKWHFPLAKFQSEIKRGLVKAGMLANLDLDAHRSEVTHFMLDRVKQWFSNQNIDHDLIDTVVANRQQDIADMFNAAQVLSNHRDDADFKNTVEALTRVMRLAEKADFDISALDVDPKLFQNDTEKNLYVAVEKIRHTAADKSLETIYQELESLRPLINDYFEANMIMDKDPKIKANRLKQLMIITHLAMTLGNLNELIVK